ncbi:hypothetical protein SXCC_03594 [Gluconacetobacter sp. SXCC-1]|nr:hypothetical protein SXCC_03594 [Gluconacetobacter sp. SXCC-1]
MPPTGHAAPVHTILSCRHGACIWHAAPFIKRYGIVLQISQPSVNACRRPCKVPRHGWIFRRFHDGTGPL